MVLIGLLLTKVSRDKNCISNKWELRKRLNKFKNVKIPTEGPNEFVPGHPFPIKEFKKLN